MSAPRKPAAEHRLDAVRAEEEAWRQILAAYPPRIRTLLVERGRPGVDRPRRTTRR